jgi:hypothetical protein
VLANRKKQQQAEYARQLEEDHYQQQQLLTEESSSQRYSQPRRAPSPENTGYSIGGVKVDTSQQGYGRVSGTVYKNELKPGGLTYYDASLDHHKANVSARERSYEQSTENMYARDSNAILGDRQGTVAPYSLHSAPRYDPSAEVDPSAERGSLRHVSDFKSRKEAWDRLQASEQIQAPPLGGPRSPYKHMDISNDRQPSEAERAVAHEKALRRRQQELYAREIFDASSQRPIGTMSIFRSIILTFSSSFLNFISGVLYRTPSGIHVATGL